MKKYKVVIVDDHKIFGEGFGALLESNNFRVLRIFQNPKLALDYFKKDNNTNMVFCDINMPNISGIDLVKSIKKINNEIKVIMISMYTDKNIINKTFKNSADGYLSKNCSIDDIKQSVKNAFVGKKIKPKFTNQRKDTSDKFVLKYKLTDREKEIIKLILDQKSNGEIALDLDISKRTVETHRKNIMLKLEVKNSIGIAVKCLENNILKKTAIWKIT